MDGLFLALLPEGRRVVVPYLVRIFHACLDTGCVPAIWLQVYLSPIGILIVDLGILDLSVPHHSYLRLWRGW